MLSFLWLENTPTENKWNLIRQYRNELLQRCDWTQILDNNLTFDQQTAWNSYRTQLRDIPQNFTNPDDVILPEQPNG